MESWEGRRTLVTGAGGFIGGHLAVALARSGAAVRALGKYNSRGGRGTLDWFSPSETDAIEVVLGDLRDPESVRAACAGVDTVFHLGAQIAIPYSFVNPRDYVETNVGGTLNVALAALEAGARRIVHLSTSEVYGDVTVAADGAGITEHQPPAPRSPYAASKVGADALMASFHHAHGLAVVIARPFNTYGPHQSARAIVPTIAAQALLGPRVRLGSLEPRRDLTFVADTVAGLMVIAAAPDLEGETLQIGTGHDVSIGELAALIGELSGSELELQLDPQRVRPGASEVPRLICDPRRMTELTGWTPQVALRDGLAHTIAWVRANQHRYRPREYAT